jgi:hypothetical protein
MRWVTDSDEFFTITRMAPDFRSATPCPEGSVSFTFESSEFCRKDFFRFVKTLMELTDDSRAFFLRLSPDPVNYFYRHFHKYPCLEIIVHDSDDAYIRALNEDPGRSPADAIGVYWDEYLIIPYSQKWFIHGERTPNPGEGGTVCVPVLLGDAARKSYPLGLYETR